MSRTFQYTAGIILIVVGIVGLFVPVLQGILLIALGILVLRGHTLKGVWQRVKGKK